MSRTVPRFQPQIVSLEPKLALTTAGAATTAVIEATLTPAEYYVARTQINVAVTRLARTGDSARVEVNLEQAARQIPLGTNLLPTLQAELAKMNRAVGGSAAAVRHAALASLDAFIRSGVADNSIVVAGRGLRERFPTLSSVGASYYIPVTNRTQQPLNVTISQSGNPLLPTTALVYPYNSQYQPPNISFSANSTPTVLVTVTPQNGTTVLGQAQFPANAQGIVLSPNGSYVNITFTY